MRKALLLALTVVVACGAGPFRGGIIGRVVPGPTTQAPVVSATVPGAGVSAAAPAAGPQFAINAPAAPEFAQIVFKGPKGLTVQWDTTQVGAFDSAPLVCEDPGKPQLAKQNFQTARSYRLKLTNIPDYPEITLYPTLTVNAVSPRTKAYLDHNALPIEFSVQDLQNVQSGNFVTKVVFLPSQQYQNLALAGGTSTVVSTQLPLGADPIVEAQNRGAILAVVRIGNKDLSLEGSMNAYAETGDSVASAQQFPVSGVNAPAWGVPAIESASRTHEIPTVPLPKEQPVLQNLDPVPSSGIPSVLDSNWNDAR